MGYIGCVGGMAYETNTVRGMVLLAVWYGKNTVCDMVRWRNGTMLRCRGYIVRVNTVLCGVVLLAV